jgi:hypothetical protein
MTIKPALYKHILMMALASVPAVWLFGCGPAREESWNSYYYGTSRQDSAYFEDYPQDNDDTYQIPWGTWKDDQMPQGQKW